MEPKRDPLQQLQMGPWFHSGSKSDEFNAHLPANSQMHGYGPSACIPSSNGKSINTRFVGLKTTDGFAYSAPGWGVDIHQHLQALALYNVSAIMTDQVY